MNDKVLSLFVPRVAVINSQIFSDQNNRDDDTSLNYNISVSVSGIGKFQIVVSLVLNYCISGNKQWKNSETETLKSIKRPIQK